MDRDKKMIDTITANGRGRDVRHEVKPLKTTTNLRVAQEIEAM